MKTLFIPARFIGKVEMDESFIGKLPEKIGIVSTSQFLNCLNSVKSLLEKSGRKVFIGKSLQGNYGQLLGCDVSSSAAIDDKVDAFLYIGSGEFHPRGVALKTSKEVFAFNPLANDFCRIERKEIEHYSKRKKAAYLKFLSSDKIGILVSMKQGQNSIKKAIELKKKLKTKECFIFIAETLDFGQLENFPFIQSWVNTACPRIDEDINCVNISEIEL